MGGWCIVGKSKDGDIFIISVESSDRGSISIYKEKYEEKAK